MVRTQTRTRTAISTTDGTVVRRVKSELDELRGYQGQFWLNFAAMFFYLASSSFVFPYLGLYMRDTLGISFTLIGLVQGASSFAGMPFQVFGGFWADHRGRRGVLLLSLLSSAVVTNIGKMTITKRAME
jgi:MFS family permease